MKKGIITAISSIIGIMAGVVIGGIGIGYLKQQKINSKDEKIDKFKGYYNLLNQWLMIKQNGKSLESYFIDKGFKSVAIYGMGEMGVRLYDELKGTNVSVKYAIDKNASEIYTEIEALGMDGDLDEINDVDIVVISATFAFNEIEEKLKKKVNVPIISLEEVVYEV